MTSPSDSAERAPVRLDAAIRVIEKRRGEVPADIMAYVMVVIDEVRYYRRMALSLERIVHNMIKDGEGS